MLTSTIRSVLAALLAFGLVIGCKSPICRVGSNNGTNEMKQWANIDDQKIGWFQSWQRYEDYRNKRIFINAPDLQLLCAVGCEDFKKEINRALQEKLIQELKIQVGFEFVNTRHEADCEIFITISKAREHHPIEYLSTFPPSNYYIYWFKVSNIATNKTVFWASGIDFFNDASHRRTYQKLIKNFNNFDRSHD